MNPDVKEWKNIARFGFILSLSVAVCGPALAAAADNYPNRPIRLIVPFPPGGPSDVVARVFSQRVGEGLGRQLVKRLHAEIARAAKHPELRQTLEAQGTEVIGNTPEQFAAALKAETAKWAKVVKATGIKPE
jgi:tripartite-type tricarboxylate transporter receptor subunit TctC